uniref:NYN domain-containing protein n=1 Tax=Panagrellus redivivus TaxID=6233 RepID=A0A7E4UR29_PANRE
MAFNLSSMPFVVRRNFIDVMPLKDLNVLRAQSDAAKILSKFRGEFVKFLNVQTDTYKDYPWYGYTLYSEVLKRQFNTTPTERLTVHMGADVDPQALLSKMELCYRDLYLLGDYDWTDVIAFVHAGVEVITLNGNMNLPVDKMEEFLSNLMNFNIKKICFFNDNCKKFWLPTAYEIIHKHIGATIKSVEVMEGFYPMIEAVTTDNKVIDLVATDLGYEYDIAMDEDFIDEEMEVFNHNVNNDVEV